MGGRLFVASIALAAVLAGCAAPASDEGLAAPEPSIRTVEETGWPLRTELHLAAGGASSEDLAWTLVIDDVIAHEGTGLPVVLPHTFTQARVHELLLEVRNGTHYAAAHATVNAAPAAAASGYGQEQEVYWVMGGTDDCPTLQRALPGLEGDGLSYDRFDLDPTTVGLPYRAEVVLPQRVVYVPHSISFLDETGAALDYDYRDYTRSWAGNAVIIEGLIPDGSVAAMVWACGEAMVEGSFVSGARM